MTLRVREELKKIYPSGSSKERNKYYRNAKSKTPWVFVFNAIKQRCEKPYARNFYAYGGRGIKCLISPEELKTLWLRDKAHIMKQPSIDRINNDGNYTLDNCRFIELVENIRKSSVGRVSEKRRKILQFNSSGKLIKEWESITAIAKELKITTATVCNTASGKHKSKHGYILRYKND